jgi:hypothetical protein
MALKPQKERINLQEDYFNVGMSDIGIQYILPVLWIRIRSDPKLLAGYGSGKINSGSEMNLK